MADIFISYSSKDRNAADQLVELLSSTGLSIWIDRHGIDVASSWSAEIVDAIDNCTTFIILLSATSVRSVNVIKEVSLAAEQKKTMFPIDLEQVELTRDLRYHLAGIQRTSITDIDGILRALGKSGREAATAPSYKAATDDRKSLMILPFDDLSPTGDNEWFANGIVSELITVLSNIKSLRVIDAQTTKEFRRYQGTLPVYAREMRIRYFVQGDVRKFGDQIKISSRLLDIETNEHLWQDGLKGTMDDIFTIQETVAKKVVEGLQVILTKEEETQLDKKPTESTRAYELWMKGSEYGSRQTNADLDRALALFEESVREDPAFTRAYVEIANVCQGKFVAYERNPALLDRAAEAADHVRRLEGETVRYYQVMSGITLRRGDAEGAESFARKIIAADPKYHFGYLTLATACQILGKVEEAVAAFEEVVSLRGNDIHVHFGLLLALHELGNPDRIRPAAERALPIFERYTRMNPDDYYWRAAYVAVLRHAGRDTEAIQEADSISLTPSLDGATLYNLACTYIDYKMLEQGMEHLRRAIAMGYKDIEAFRRDPDLAPLRDTPEFNTLLQELEDRIAKDSHG